MLDESVDFTGAGSAAVGYPQASAPVNDFWFAALYRCHRPDDCLYPRELIVLNFGALQLLGHSRHHTEQVVDWAHLLDGLHLLEEVVEGEFTLHEAGSSGFGLLLVEGLLGLFDEAEHVAHAEDPARHAIGVELLEGVQFLAGAGEGDRSADDLFDAQRRSTAGVAVELGQDDAVDGERLVEPFGRVHRVLAGHGVNHQEGVVRFGSGRDPAHLLHQLLVDREATGGVDDQHVLAEAAGLLQTPLGYRDRIALARANDVICLGEHRDVDLAAEGAQLLDSGRALKVCPYQERVAALALEPARKLSRCRGLSRALQARHEDDRGRSAGVRELEDLPAEHGGEFLVDDLDDLLSGVERLGQFDADGLLPDSGHHRANHPHVDVRLEQGRTDLREHLVDIGLGEATLPAQALENAVKAVGQAVEHETKNATAERVRRCRNPGGPLGGAASPDAEHEIQLSFAPSVDTGEEIVAAGCSTLSVVAGSTAGTTSETGTSTAAKSRYSSAIA
ncbi:unannotated protein [freshwater metagenome]|uniref:Unannotated protein n=1 Tax=freshwater metagenome TaxID=449393 RepID=A0A6J7CLR5_9ZZZZ